MKASARASPPMPFSGDRHRLSSRPTMDISKALPRRSDRNVVGRRRSIGGDGIAAALPDWLGWLVQTSPPEAAMKMIPWLAALAAAALATPAGADGPRHELSATSKAVIEI